MKVFIIPFAGGSKYSYQPFVKDAVEGLEVVPLELPGRGSRTREAKLTSIHAMAEDVLRQINPWLNEPYILYGHSMGALIGYVAASLLAERKLPLPQHLFLSGAKGPRVGMAPVLRHTLPRAEFLEELRKLGGSPEALLQDEAMMNFFEPVLRADFQATDTYSYEDTPPLHCPTTIMIGSEEGISMEEANTWRKHFQNPIEIIELAGNHFFIFDHTSTILQMIKKQTQVVQNQL